MSDASGYLQPASKKRAALFVAVPVAVVLLVLVIVLFTRKSADDRAAFTPLQDKPAPAIAGGTFDGKTYDLDAYRGRWVVVNFFATWCIPCQAEHPELVSFALRHAQLGDAEIVSVVFQDDVQNVKDYFAKNGGDWPVLTSDDGRIALDYSVTGVPESFLVDPAGIVRERLIGGVTSVELDSEINRLTLQYFPTASTASSSSSG
ncbi:MAG: cytochrome c biosis protein CcmG, thiol:disulfide interchange protein DsbE [Acidimicrobiaceae bacterium]